MATANTTSIEKARALLTQRLAEVNSEAERLNAALEALDDKKGLKRAPQGRPRNRGKVTAGRTATRKRARPGERRAQLLAEIRRSPGAKVSELATAMNAPPQSLYPILKRLRTGRKIRKHGKGFAVVKASK